MTRRSHWFRALKSRMSWRNCSARSRFVFPRLTLSPLIRVTYLLSNTAGIGRISRRKSATGSRSAASRTPALHAAVSASSAIGSHAPKARSLRSSSGTNSRISGERPSVRLARRIVGIWVSDPMGAGSPRRTRSTPAMNVVATAPNPGVRTPSRPVAGRTADGRAPGRARGADEPCTWLLSFQCWTGGGTLPAHPQRNPWRVARQAGLGVGQRRVIDECDPLNHRHPGGHRQNDDDETEHPAVEGEAEEGLRRRQQRDALGALEQADLCIDAERLGAR